MQILSARLSNTSIWPLGILLLLHAVGVIGLSSAFYQYFLTLTPLNLLISAIIIVASDKDRDFSLATFIVSCFIIGFLAEWIGVHYEWLFGTYIYGQTLGWKVSDIPIIIGINWLIIIYSIGNIMNLFAASKLIKVLLGAALAVLLDVFIEPVAIHYDFWSWENITPPLQNYIGWFVVSSLLLVIFFQKPDRSSNKSAIAFLFIQLGFFALLNLRLMIAG